MQQLINSKENIVEEMMEGTIKAHGNLVKRLEDSYTLVRSNKKKGKVTLISGGGSGHEPAHGGYVGEGMLDAAVAGEIFTSPGADKVYQAIKSVNEKEGTLLIIKNYSGDVMNFEMAKDMAEAEGILVDTLIVNDDIAVEDSTYTTGRRGVAGTVLVHKILGAASEKGYSLSEIKKLGSNIVKNLKTLGMATTPCTLPTTGERSFVIGKDKVEIGLGIHGEPGTHREKLREVNDHIDSLMDKILKEFGEEKLKKVAVLINGLGATTQIELYIINNHVTDILVGKGIEIRNTYVGNYMTSLDMGGFSITILNLDDEMETLLKEKANTIGLKVF